jgi:hypothetical protein
VGVFLVVRGGKLRGLRGDLDGDFVVKFLV